MARFAISNINNITITRDANTTNSRYPVLDFVPFRKFATRAQARTYKRTRRDPQQYAIIDTVTKNVVR